jgi:hypothetical protein
MMENNMEREIIEMPVIDFPIPAIGITQIKLFESPTQKALKIESN